MKYLIPVLVTVAVSLPGCASHDGVYSPACIAYTGSEITFSGGRFVWDRFTDVLQVDADGNVADPFPGYPLQGRYKVKKQVVSLDADSGDVPAILYLQEYRKRTYLLSAEEFETWERTGAVGTCSLVLGGYPGSQ